jgi:acetate kinase
MRILTVNAGSSSLKLRLLEDQEVRESADLEVNADDLDADEIERALGSWPRPDVIGHRVVHGGTDYSGAVMIDDDVRRRLAELTDLAPLHQPKSLAALDAVSDLLPDVDAVACFDTAFHRTIGDAAALYAIPQDWRDRGIRRYGFHGLSHAYAARRAREVLGLAVDGSRVITCHLGAGASLCAVRDGRSVDTTMGFTPLEGLVMATRSGTVDPGAVLWMLQHEGLGADEVATALEKRSGLQGLAGSADLREVQDAAERGDQQAVVALQVYLHRLVAGIAAMAAALDGVDAIAFTGGVGENAASIRLRTSERLAWLGMHIDADRNAAADPDCEISTPQAGIRSVVITAREDLQMAREIAELRS